MAVISVRLNEQEERILEYLTDYYEEDRSTLIKLAIIDKYQDIKDLKTIEKFEKKERQGKAKFLSAEEILNKLDVKKSG